ncbi:MAG TPA: cytidylate kinase-like family protein [Ruminiclostridium sp.]|nr:cytidylate kinase-like family protein [Ruminiclostridium sp.]
MGKVITVTREFGSMGRKIAKMVADKAGFKYYDRDIIELAAKEIHGNVEELSAFEEKNLSLFAKMAYPLGHGTAIMQDKLYEMEKSIIIDLASAEDCVIVGRCSDYILHECRHKEMLNVFIYAPYESRIAFSADELKLSGEKAKSYISKVDKARIEFYKSRTGVSFYSTKYRSLMIDSSAMSHEVCADIICAAAKSRFGTG